jgi:hypothetical protein
VCSEITCKGCCSDILNCLPLNQTSPAQCGNSGAACERCDGGAVAGACNANGVCGLFGSTCPMGQCATGNTCVDAGYPRCQPSGVQACVWCDPLRGDHCDDTVVLASCRCGSKAQCQVDEQCVRQFDGGAVCAPFASAN